MIRSRRAPSKQRSLSKRCSPGTCARPRSAARPIAREVTDAVRKNVTIDWTMRENVRAQLQVIIKRILRKYGYPPDKQERATQTVLEQVELLGWEVAAA